ncbi:6-hydroxymethylpterin diphosphokinase MptE-like protein [Catenovulum sp. SX2]|uniref:6-hydroxymethylpterin diphosphokinase MptE-like protein n=1 Tax=Catenovulum sp. SX2 TaxID=3398614 RepID=UPI003F82792B
MLKDIRLHIEQDEEKQSEIEANLAADIKRIHARNIQAFSYHIPSLLELVQHVQTSNAALICNKFGEKNIVDYGNGRTLYGLNPLQEIDKQYQEFCRFPQKVELAADSIVEQGEDSDQDENSDANNLGLSTSANYQEYLSRTALPQDIEVLVVLGIGLGRHIQSLIANHNIRHLVVYEPEVQYFQCSVMATDWENMLDQAKAKKTSIYLQVNKDGRDITADLSELNQHFAFEQFYLYQHYHHPIFDSVAASLRDHTWQYCVTNGIRVKQQSAANYIPIWTQSIALDTVEDVEKSDSSFFKNNIAAFKKYYPAIAKEFERYQSKTWNTVLHADKQINLIENNTLACWHGDDPKTEGEQNFANFSRYPNKDGLVLGYKGTKLKHYLHYQFVAETEKILEELEEEAGQLPEEIKSLIVFGIGTGYQLDSLFANHRVENLFICEPNRDFFYASLHAIDWAKYLKQIDDSGARLYLNIGDDGTHLFRDLLNQFYSIGPYILANTYFYQSYYNSNLVSAVAQLREQLQVVISMGEYYDHARYGIAHTTETISRGYPFLIKDAAKKLSYQDKEVPIFLVGNGPSLDKSIETIKEWKEQAIVISCGTALMPLYKNGIVPDFHAEIEQNRSTFDWICRIGDFDYLKKISLISCNGIHPDTCDLFKDVYLAFKEGESSTISALTILGRENYEELKFAFPTVSNFALNLFTNVGFNQIYLFGVDLGFVDPVNHHSQQSGYYLEEGKELYNYQDKNNTSLVIPGNFRQPFSPSTNIKFLKQ